MAQTTTPPTAPGLGGNAPVVERGNIIGRFVVLDHLGAGGMGLVISAYDPHLDRKVALKLLRGDVWQGPLADAGRQLLKNEAQAMARLSHPNVVTVHEIGFDTASAYVVMEQVSGGRTLRQWLDESPRSWREIVALLSQAGEGLAAAHRAHIVHRDFKPENILIGDDARPKVTDFGIAAAFSTLARESSVVAGTRGYMAPEQALGAAVDARADQYAFCVTLWEALHGEPPPPDASPPASRKGPPRLYRALARGLSLRPEDRFPSMDALLSVLRRHVGVRRPATALLLTAALLAAASFVVGRRLALRPRCSDGESLIASIWSGDARNRVHDAFVGTHRPYAAHTFASVDSALKRRIRNWGDAHDSVCTATHLRHEQSEALLDQRMECLGRVRSELEALVTVLGNADATVLDHAIEAAQEEGSIAACVTVGALSPAPPSLASHKQLEELQVELARLTALRRVGNWKDGLQAARKLVERLRPLGDSPLLASAVLDEAWFELNAGDEDRAIQGFYEAAQLGAATRQDEVVIEATHQLSRAYLLSKDRVEEGAVAVSFAAASAARLGYNAQRLAGLFHLESVVRAKRGERGPATLLAAVAVVLEAVHGGVESAGVAHAIVYLGDMLYSLGYVREATWVQGYSIAIGEKLYGPDHPDLADLLQSYSDRLWQADEYDQAGEVIARALAIQERAFGEKDARVAESLYRLAIAREGQRRLPEARAAITRCIHIDEAVLGPAHPYVAARYEELGLIAHLEGHLEEAHEVTRKAFDIRYKAYGLERLAVGGNFEMDAQHLLSLRRYPEAQAAAERALEIFAKKGDSEGPYAASGLTTLGRVLLASGQTKKALQTFDKALPIYEKVFGAEAVALRPVLLALTDALLEGGDATRALATAERLSRLQASAPGDAAAGQFRLARARFAVGQDRVAALSSVKAARAALAALPFPSEDLPAVDRWLAHPR